jgi:GTPase SAR1 family protein
MSSVTKSTAPITITRGLIQSAARLALYGPEGVGKTTITAGFPEPVFIDTEGGQATLVVTPSKQTFLIDTGYDGFVGHEYLPRGDVASALKASRILLDVK